MTRSGFCYLAVFALFLVTRCDAQEAVLPLRTNDIVAFVGGADVATAQQTGHLESLLACAFPTARFRDFGWEGDTVFTQPRDFGFPPLGEHLRKARATVIVLQFGRTEALAGSTPGFVTAYKAMVEEFRKITSRLILVIPPPFENPGGLLPDLTQKNATLGEYAKAIREVARVSDLPIVDLLSQFQGDSERLTEDGLQLTVRGLASSALAFARQLGLKSCVEKAGVPRSDGVWPDGAFEELRQAIIVKNRYWFNYWRPQNWAFLGGDRTEQPSSRDHRDPKVRWFPKEIEEFKALLERQEKEVTRLALLAGQAR